MNPPVQNTLNAVLDTFNSYLDPRLSPFADSLLLAFQFIP